MKIPTPITKKFTFEPGFHLHALRHVEHMIENLLKDHPSPNRKNPPGMEGEFADNIAENYEAFASLKTMIAEAADCCESATLSET
jgi:enolase